MIETMNHLVITCLILYFATRDWRRTQVAKGTLCKSVMHRFESDRRLKFHSVCAGVAELVDAKDLKSFGFTRSVRVRVPPSVPNPNSITPSFSE